MFRLFFSALAITAFLSATLSVTATKAEAKTPKRVLVVTVTKGFRHDSIPLAESTIQTLATESGKFTVDYARTDEDIAKKMTPEALKGYDTVIFANTTGDLPLPDKDAFIAWIRNGHGFVGMHSASDTFHGYLPYLEMLGGEFKTHGPQVSVKCIVEDGKHPATKTLPGNFDVFEEVYEFQKFDRARVHGLLHLDAHPQTKEPGYNPIAWCRKEGKGRVFYTALGHRQEVWNSTWYHEHLLGGILWSLGLQKGDDKPQVK